MNTKKSLSIDEYALFILEDERVKEALKKIDTSHRMHDHFLAFPLDKVNADELAYMARYRDALKRAKEKSILEILRKSMSSRWLYVSDLEGIAHNVIAGEPSYEDLPIIMLWHFATDPAFRPFLLDGVLLWFSDSLPSERTRQFVFALFLWLKMDVRYDSVRERSYYVKAEPELTKAHRLLSHADRLLVSTVSDRLHFIELFKDYIHTDLWRAEDYDKQGKHGIVVRLRLATSIPGQVVLQECGEKTIRCNKLYMASEDSVKKIQSVYLEQNRLLRMSPLQQQQQQPTELTFQCRQCGSGWGSACMFMSMKREEQKPNFYCNMKYFYDSKQSVFKR